MERYSTVDDSQRTFFQELDDPYPVDFRSEVWEPDSDCRQHLGSGGLEGPSSCSDDEFMEERRGGWCRPFTVGLGLVFLALACWLGVMLYSRHAVNASQAARVERTGLGASNQQSSTRFADPRSMASWAQHLSSPKQMTPPLTSQPATLTLTFTTTSMAPSMDAIPLDHVENLHDGNVCKGDEEFLAGLCYKKCSLLTGGFNPVRTSPWTCCNQRPCRFNQQLSIGMRVACSGYAVSGDGSCPHRPGACLDDEELLLGVCYKRCRLLTDGEYPNRMASATCCKASGLSCLDFRKDYTSREFAVGGGRDQPGACFRDEEMVLGTCYRKCSLLTNDMYPHRVGAFTCCRARQWLPHVQGGVWHLGCFNLFKHKSSASFAITGDQNHTSVAYDAVHLPLKGLTEAKGGRKDPGLIV